MSAVSRSTLAAASVGILLLVIVHDVAAFKLETHRRLNLRAANASMVAPYLRDELDVPSGLESILRGQPVREWIRTGGAAEDLFLDSEFNGAVNRSRHHFHNPLLPWTNAGLDSGCRVFPFLPFLSFPVTGQASIHWAQSSAAQLAGGDDASWAAARNEFHRSLTLGAKNALDENIPSREAAAARVFQILGQQMHLIADLAVPAHVRNDIHCGPASEPFEVWAESKGIGQSQNAVPIRPGNGIFTVNVPISDDVAKVPAARLWDSDQYTLTNPQVTLSPTIGLAEFTNANFWSKDTVLSPSFPFPARTSIEQGDLFYTGTGHLRSYWVKARDGVTSLPNPDDPGAPGPPFNRFAVATSLDAFLAPDLQAKKVQFDDAVHDQYAKLLFPRAIGYSAALLDYFFRGRLDVDVFADPDDPEVVQVRGTNASGEPLDAGTLRLYADDPAGVRTPLTPASPTADLTVTAAAGAPVVSAQFRMSPDAERVVAVYQGTLGEEKPDPSRAFPGAVVGKVLGGVRVEEVFADAATQRWMLRTPTGVFPLQGLTTAEYERVTWGDGQDIVLAWTPFTPQQAVFRTFTVPRQPGSIEPVLTETPTGPEVALAPRQTASFPFGMAVGPTVTFADSLDYLQRFGRYERTDVYIQKDVPPFGPTCVYDRTALGAVTLETAHAQPIAFSGSFPLVLDVAHNEGFGTTDQPYVWLLRQVGATRDGALRALVSVRLTRPAGQVTVPYFKLNQHGVKEPDGEVAVPARFPYSPEWWVLIDLKDGTVLGSTAGAGAEIALAVADSARGFPRVYRHATTDKRACGEPADPGTWAEIQPRPATATDPLDIVVPVDTASGTRSFAPGQWLTTELQDLGRFDVSLQLFQAATDLVYDCVVHAGQASCGALQQSDVSGAIVPGESFHAAARAVGQTAQERVVFLSGQGGFGDAERAVLWEPPAHTARILFAPRLLGESGYLISGATGAAVLVTALAGTPFYVASLDGDPAPRVFEQTDGSGLVLLEPRFLYDPFVLKFLRLTEPPLGPAPVTALPATLAGGTASNPIDTYHAIRVP